jgi:uncharacterized protein
VETPEVFQIAVRSSSLGGRGVFAAKSFIPDELIELCPLLILERSLWGSSAVLDDHIVSVNFDHTSIALPLGYGALYNHGDYPNAIWTVGAGSSVMEVRATTRIALGEEILVHYGNLFFESRGLSKKSVASTCDTLAAIAR